MRAGADQIAEFRNVPVWALPHPDRPSRSVVSDAKIAQLERQFAAYARSVAEVLARKQPLHIGSAKS
jgi:hypothetical protein